MNLRSFVRGISRNVASERRPLKRTRQGRDANVVSSIRRLKRGAPTSPSGTQRRSLVWSTRLRLVVPSCGWARCALVEPVRHQVWFVLVACTHACCTSTLLAGIRGPWIQTNSTTMIWYVHIAKDDIFLLLKHIVCSLGGRLRGLYATLVIHHREALRSCVAPCVTL